MIVFKKKNLLFFKLNFPCVFFQNIVLSLEDRDAEELILVLCGYHKLLTERELDVIQDTAILQQQEEEQQQQGMHIRCFRNYGKSDFNSPWSIINAQTPCEHLKSPIKWIENMAT